MANTYSFRHGQRDIRQFAVDSATVIEVGDMLWLDTDDVKPVSSATLTSEGTLVANQATFAETFVGIAVQSSASGSTDAIDVDVSGDSVYEFACASGTYEVGDPMGPDSDGAGTFLDQTLEAAVEASAIARVHTRVTAAATKVKVQFASSIGRPNVNANLG